MSLMIASDYVFRESLRFVVWMEEKRHENETYTKELLKENLIFHDLSSLSV